jgi:ribonuclease J
LYDSVKDRETALLISHPHQDHYGLIEYVDKKIPVYLGRAAHKLIEISAIFAGKDKTIENPCYFESYKPFQFGDIEITPYLMDHAAFDAYAFLIRGEGKSLLYTGDFRAHGRKWKLFYKFTHIAPKNVDYLLMEGTTLSRDRQKALSEEQLENKFINTFKEIKSINFVYVSGQNVDRLVTIYRACKRRGKIFVIDFYIAYVLSELAALGSGVPYPSAGYPEIRVFFPSLLQKKIERFKRNDIIDRFKQYEITKEKIDEMAKIVVMTVRPSMDYDLKNFRNLAGGNIIYSMWEGYKENIYTDRFLSSLAKRGMTLKTIHTSGHADYPTQQKLLAAVQPKELIPIHTLAADQYQEAFPESSVKVAHNGEILGDEQNGALEPKSDREGFGGKISFEICLQAMIPDLSP